MIHHGPLCPSTSFECAASRPTALRHRRQINPNVGYHPPPPFVRAAHVFCDPLSRRRVQTHPRFRLLVRPRAAGQPSRPPGAGLENETALQDAHRRWDAALQVRRRPLLHSTVGTVPVGHVPSHRRRRKLPKHKIRHPAAPLRSRSPTLRSHTEVPAAQIAATAAYITIPAAYIAAPAAHARPRPPTLRSEPPTTRLGPPTSRLLPPTSRTRPPTTPHRPQTRTTTAAYVALGIATVASGPSPIAPMVSGPGSSTHASLGTLSLPLHSRAGSSHLHSRRAGDAPLRRRHGSARRRRNRGAAGTGDLQPTSYSGTNNYFFSIQPPASRHPTAEPTQPLSLPPQSLGGTCGGAPSVPTVFPASAVT